MTATLANSGNHHWQAFGASSIGKAHIDSGLPNQDSIFYHKDAEFCVAVVCDGAGSARFSQDGSKFFSQAVANYLISLGKNLINAIPNHEIRASAIEEVNRLINHGHLSNSQFYAEKLNIIRQRLVEQSSNEASLRDYHTTVTAVLLLEPLHKALLIQVGDSPLLTSQFVVNEHHIDYFNNLQLFGDDSKNEYVNETHFITQDNWQDFLRVQWLDVANVDLIALMSDGCADLVLQGASQTPKIYRPFFGNLLFNVCQSQTGEQGSAMIEQAIGNPATYRLTGDDKSLIILVKNGTTYQGIEPIIEIEEVQKTPSTTPASVWTTSADSVSSSAEFQPTNHQQNTQTANLQTPKPVDTPLPQAVPISANGKQRRNTAVIASVAILAGTGVLGWLNFAKIQSLINPQSSTTNSPVLASVAPQKSVPNLPPLTLSPVGQVFDLHSDLMIGNVSPHFFIQTLMAIPKPVAKNSSANALPLFNGHQSFADTTLINPNRLPFNVSSTNEKGDILEQRLSLDYAFQCEPILPSHQPIYQKLGINFLPNYDYQFCRIDLIAPKNPNFNFVLEPQFSRIFIKGGIGQMLGHETTTTIEKQRQQLGDRLSAIKLYYLPNNFSPNQSVTK